MPLPSNSVNTVRNSGMQVVQPVLNHWPAETVVTGTISFTPTEYPVGQVSVTWDSGAWNNIRVGQLWIIRSGSNIVSYGVVRRPSNSTTLYIDGKSRGDSGLAESQAFGITAGQTITVYTMMPLWSLLSRIIDGDFFKQFDIPYSNEGSNPAPVVNIGSWRQGFYDPLINGAEFTFSNDNSFAWGNKTLSSYLWGLPGTATVLSGTITTADITIRLPQGFHIVRCTVQDSGGASSTGYRPVWVNGPDYLSLSEQMAFQISSDSQDRKGRSQSIMLVGDLSSPNYLPGMAFHYKEYAEYDGSPLPDDILIDTFSGFASEETRTYDLANGEKAVEFQVMGPYSWMEMIPMVSQAIVEVQTPSAWTDIASGLGIPQFIIWYILKHHSTFLSLFDYDPFFEYDSVSGNPDNPRKLNWGLNGSTLAEYVNQVAKTIGGNVGCKSDGTLAFRRDPNIEFIGYRDTVDELMTLTINEETGVVDFAEKIEIPKRFHNDTGQLRVFTLAYDGNETIAFGSIAPGYTQMQAPGSSDEDSYIIKPDQGLPGTNFPNYRPGGQDMTNILSGHLLAKANNPTPEIRIALVRNMDFFEPPEMAWVRVSIPASWSPKGQAINTRALPISVDRSWEEAEGGAFVKVITMSVEPETFGQPGETYNLDTGGGSYYVPVIPPIGVNLTEDEELLNELGVAIAIDSQGDIGRTKDGENWEKIRGNVVHPVSSGSSKFNDITFDVFSEYVLNGYVEGALGAWAVVAEEFAAGSGIHDTVQIWYTADILQANVTWTKQFEGDTGGSNVDGSLRIRANPETEDYAAVAMGTTNGMYIIRTTDGVSWEMVDSGDVVNTNDINGNAGEVDFAFMGNSIICSGWEIATSKWLLTRFANPGASSTFVANSPEGDIPWPMIEKHLESSRVYATKVASREISGTSGIEQVVVEVNPQTAFGSPGSETPSTTVIYSGGLTSDDIITYVRGDPNEGLNYTDAETRRVAGYHDSNRTTPVTSICGPGTMSEYGRDDGWHFNSTPLAANLIQNEPVEFIKWLAFVAIKGRADFHASSFFGYFTFTNTSTSFYCNTLASQIGSLSMFCELGDEFGVIQQRFGSGSTADADGFSFSASDTPSTSPTGVILDTSAEANDNIRYVLLRFSMAGREILGDVNYMMPLTKGWEVELKNIVIEEPTLYAITSITSGSPTFDDITPTGFNNPNEKFTPRNPYSYAIDTLDSTAIISVMERTAGGGKYIATSASSGNTWSVNTNDQTFLRGLRLSGGFGLAWGYNRLLATNDAFAENVVDLSGNWESVFNREPGVIRVLKAALVSEY